MVYFSASDAQLRSEVKINCRSVAPNANVDSFQVASPKWSRLVKFMMLIRSNNVQANYGSLADVRKLASEVTARCKTLDILINNAGQHILKLVKFKLDLCLISFAGLQEWLLKSTRRL